MTTMTIRLARRRTSTYGLTRPARRVTSNGLRLVTWFKVDDSFHSHPKQTAASLAAVGLWTVAGSWSAKHLTDGFVPDHQIPSLSRGQIELAKELVSAGLWRRTKGGYQFHQWDADIDGTVRNFKKKEVVAQRRKKSSGGQIGNHRRWHEARGITDPDCPYCQGEHRYTDRYSDRSSDSPPIPPVPSRPDPKDRTPMGSDPREVTQSSSVSVGDARETLTDDDLKIDQTIIGLLAELTGRTVSPNHATSVRRQILGGRTVDKPLPYVARAIRERPKDFLPAAPAADRCPIHHLEQPCRSCAADRKAAP